MRRLLLALLLVLLAAPSALAQSPASLEGDRRVYDETGSSLTDAQAAGLERRLAALKQAGADGLVLVRAKDAGPEETLEQVERLQQTWVKETGAAEDTAFAILVNRNPEDPKDARAGIFVGKSYRDGNVPEGEQRDIVDDALIPPLRDGDVSGSFADGLDRLRSDILNGPPTSAFEDFAADATDSWLPWTLLGLALAALGGALALFGRRARSDLPDEQPRTIRPGGLPPELGGALAHGSPTVLVMPAALLELAARDALAIEPESEGGRFGQPKVRVRLTDRSRVDGALEELVWARLAELAEDDLVASENLQKLTAEPDPVQDLARDGLRERGWLDEGAGRPRAGLVAVAVLGLLLGALGLALVGVGGGGLLPIVAVAVLLLVGFAALVMANHVPDAVGGRPGRGDPLEGLQEGARAGGEGRVDDARPRRRAPRRRRTGAGGQAEGPAGGGDGAGRHAQGLPRRRGRRGVPGDLPLVARLLELDRDDVELRGRDRLRGWRWRRGRRGGQHLDPM